MSDARRTIDELKDYAESTSREAHREPESDGGFECVWRVRCVACPEKKGIEVVARYYGQKAWGSTKEDTKVHAEGAKLFPTQSDAIAAAEEAGWYVDAKQALCPECHNQMTELGKGNE